MGKDYLSMEEYEKRLRQAETENRHLCWKLRLTEATTQGFHMRDVISALSQICGGAVFFLDEDLNVAFFEGEQCLGSNLAKELLKQDSLRFSELRTLLSQSETVSAATLDNGDLCYSGRFIINTIEPFYLLLITEQSFSTEDAHFLFEAAKQSFTTVDLHRQSGPIPFGDFRSLMHLIITGQLQDWNEIEAYMKRLPNPPKRFLSICVVRIDVTRRNAVNTASFISKLRSFFPGCSATSYEDLFILLVSSSDKHSIQPRPSFNREAFSEFLSDNEAFAAFSNATQRMDMLRTQYILAESTLRLGRSAKNNQQRVLFFEDYADYIIIELLLAKYKEIMGHDDVILLTNPHVVRIYRHDKLYGTNLQTVLYNYCQFKGNISAAAKASFMHRNTFAAKVAEVKALISEDLNDPSVQQRMIFSYKIFQFINLFYEKQTTLSMMDRLNEVALRTQKLGEHPVTDLHL